MRPAAGQTLKQVLGDAWTEVEPGVYVLVEMAAEPRPSLVPVESTRTEPPSWGRAAAQR